MLDSCRAHYEVSEEGFEILGGNTRVQVSHFCAEWGADLSEAAKAGCNDSGQACDAGAQLYKAASLQVRRREGRGAAAGRGEDVFA